MKVGSISGGRVGRLRRLGVVLHTSASTGDVILRCEGRAEVGDKVYDSKINPVGEIFDVFGPVKSPYASIRTFARDRKLPAGQPLYCMGDRVPRKRRH